MSDLESQSQFNEFNEKNNEIIVQLQPYVINEVLKTEMFKLACCGIAILFSIVCIIMAAMHGCIYNCQN